MPYVPVMMMSHLNLRHCSAIAAAWFLLAMPAQAQTAVKLDGACTRLVIAGEDLSASCKGTLTNLVSRGRASFDFAAQDGRTLSFSGNGAPQERTEESDPLQPINLVIPGKGGAAGVVQTPTLAIGACRFTTPESGKTGFECEASTPDGTLFAGSFVTATTSAPGASTP